MSKCPKCEEYISTLVNIACVLGMPRKPKRKGDYTGCTACKCEGCDYEHVEASFLARDALPKDVMKRIPEMKRRWRPIGEGLGHEVIRLRKLCEKARKYVTGYAAGSEKNLKWFKYD